MARLTADSTGAGGLGTRTARWVFIFMWLCGVWLGLIDRYFSPADLLNASAYGAGFIGGLLLTTGGQRRLSLRRVIWLPVLATYLTAVSLYRAPAVMEVWAVTFAAYLVAFLFPRGNPIAATVGSALVVGYALIWGLWKDPTSTQLGHLIGIPVGCVAAGITWHLVLRWMVMKERAHRGAAAEASEQAEVAAEAIAASDIELARIREQAEPQLARISAGETIDEAAQRRLTIVEASIRDLIRAPQLQHQRLIAECERLRSCGVTVVLLGEPVADGATIGPDLAEQIARLIAPVSEGRVTVRSLPEGRTAAVSVVLQRQGRPEQTLLAPDGQVLFQG